MRKEGSAALALCAALLLCAACGPEPSGSSPTPAPTPAPTGTPAPTQAPTPDPTPTPTAGIPIIAGTPVPVKVDFAFTRSNFPRLDGSATLAPLAQSVCSTVLRVNREEVADLVRFNQTTTAYYDLLWGYADLLLAGAPGSDVLEEKESRSFQWESAPFLIDALVVAVNADNPVKSLTVKQLRGIYTGEITNWKQVGGKNEDILPIQRAEGTQSQSMAERLLMDGVEMMEPVEGLVAQEPEDLAALVQGDGTYTGAIGYSIYYFSDTLRAAEGVRLLPVSKVEPNADTIRAGKYPLVEPYYVVLPADTPEDAPSRVLFDWLLGEEGQKLVVYDGYVPVKKVEMPAPEPEEPPAEPPAPENTQ